MVRYIVCFAPYKSGDRTRVGEMPLGVGVVGFRASTQPTRRAIALPLGDGDFSMRLRLIKTYVTKRYRQALRINRGVSQSRQKRGESNLWQRRFWEHLIRDEQDFALHCDYIPIRFS